MQPTSQKWYILPLKANQCRNAIAVTAPPILWMRQKTGVSKMAGAKLLLVEDDAALPELLIWNFKKEEYDVIQTPDGEEALLLVKEHRPRSEERRVGKE